MAVIVRPAAPEDAAGIADCLGALGYGTPAELVAAQLRDFEVSPIDAVFVATVTADGPVAGVVSIHLIPLFHAPGQLARLTSLAVVASVRRQGVATALVDAAESFARRAGCGRVEVTSGDHRPEAHQFYRARGYLSDERRFIKRF